MENSSSGGDDKDNNDKSQYNNTNGGGSNRYSSSFFSLSVHSIPSPNTTSHRDNNAWIPDIVCDAPANICLVQNENFSHTASDS